jgi:hypothetical protein
MLLVPPSNYGQKPFSLQPTFGTVSHLELSMESRHMRHGLVKNQPLVISGSGDARHRPTVSSTRRRGGRNFRRISIQWRGFWSDLNSQVVSFIEFIIQELKEFEPSRDVLFDEGEFFNARHVVGHSEAILPSR